MGTPHISHAWSLCVLASIVACRGGPIDRHRRDQAATNAERLAAVALWDTLRVDVAHPPVVDNKDYRTTVVYQDDAAYRVYFSSTGKPEADVLAAQRPAGTFRNVCVIVDHPSTDFASAYTTTWPTVQARVNQAHRDFALSQGLAEPIVQFEFTNLLVAEDAIADPSDAAQVQAYLAQHGFPDISYDIAAVLDLDARTPTGGFTHYGGKVLHVGWLFQAVPDGMRADLTDKVLSLVASTVYGHEVAHIWGWEHAWDASMAPDQDPLLPWTQLSLFGWTDTNGNGVPEILDPNPY